MYERSHVSVKVEPGSTSLNTLHLASILFKIYVR